MTELFQDLFAAWGATSPEAREKHSDAAISADIYYADPNAPDPVIGRDAYLAYIAHFSEMLPGGSAEVASVDGHHGHARVTVDFLKDGEKMMRGQYYADIADGRVTRLVGFPGTGEPA